MNKRLLIPLWIIAISLGVIALCLFVAVTPFSAWLVTTIHRVTQAPAPTLVPGPVPIAAPTPTADLCAQSSWVPYRHWSRHWGQYEGALLYYRGKVVRLQLAGGDEQVERWHLLIDVLTTPSGQSFGRGLVWLREANMVRGDRVLEHDFVEVIGQGDQPVTDGGKLLPALQVVALQNLAAESPHCADPTTAARVPLPELYPRVGG